MMIKHDEKWLNRIDCLCVTFCREYHEHQLRWRPLTELPDDGERVEILCNNAQGKRHSCVDEFIRGVTFELPQYPYWKDIAWRPAPLGELPEAG